MSAVTMPRSTSLSFPRLVRSEWIKLRSIRSTVWCYAIVVVLTLAMASLLGAVDTGVQRGAPTAVANELIVQVSAASVSLTALVVGVLGVLIITGEYGTGQIRSTFTADPGRTGVVLAKAFVLALTTFVVSAVATWIGVAITTALQADRDIRPDLADPAVFMPILGSSVYVTLVALLAFGIGLLVRSSAGGIAITLGILLVLPTIVQIIGGLTNQQWIMDASQFLPSSAGAQLYTFDSGAQQGDGLHLGGWGGFGVLAGEVVVIGAIALAAARSRDV
ncbi:MULTISPECIES: ABC transporter permease [unclassified Curtobacterium]|jgi:ABC-2 type transport system permease protein|uniref:ABC transporter permease n=1 Tax=unclassified Curtobacterium TaxID=257496 RepID=UPI0025B2C8B1|nr:ABC transporter permease [Curtobacterium sp. 458]WJY01678.1 ABC transporter permease [Curtobacterium sp. 458]